MRMELVGCNHQKRLKLDSEAENHSLFCNLTDELVLEILLRLPSKCSVRCKAVCKRWHAIISDSNYFIRSFIQHHHQIHGTCVDLFSLVFQNFSFNPQRQEKWSQIQAISENLISSKWGEGHTIDMSYIPCVTRPVPVLEGPQEFKLEAFFADLLLCSHNNPSTLLTIYYICNIVTKQWVALPPIPRDSVEADVGLLCNIPSCFECSKQHDFYKFKFWLVRIPLSKLDKIDVHFNVDVDLFSSEEGRWTHSLAYLPRVLNECYEKSPMIAYHGMLHKLTRDGIIVLDPTQQRVVSRIIGVPPIHYTSWTDCLGVTQDRLRISEVHVHDNGGVSALSVWELEDYDNSKWCLAFKFSTETTIFLGRLVRDKFYITVLAFHPYRRNILLLHIGRFIVLCHYWPPKKKFKFRRLYKLDHKFGDIGAFPLVYNWWPTPVPSFP